MGDGGVACVPLQQQHKLMEKFPISDTAYCGVSGNSNGKLENKPIKNTVPKRMKLKRDAFFKKEEPEKKNELVSQIPESSSYKEAENGEVGLDNSQKEEVEEGELGTLKSPVRELENGELTPDKSQKAEIEKGEIVHTDKWKKGEPEKGEFVPAKCRKWETEFSLGIPRSDAYARRGRTPDKHRRGDGDRSEFGLWRRGRDDIEKGEFIPDRWHKRDYFRDGHCFPKSHRHCSSRERDWRNEHEWTPHSIKHSGEIVSPDKEYCRSGNSHFKRSARWEGNQDRCYYYPKFGSKIADQVTPYKVGYGHGKTYGKDYSSGSRLKRHSTDSDSIDRRYYDDHGDYPSSKSRRLSTDSGRPAHSEHISRRSVEKEYRISSTSRINHDRNSLRHYDSSTSRSAYDRYGRSPSHCDKSPHERSRYRDHIHRDQTPVCHERSPHDRSRHNDNRYRSPSYAERSPQEDLTRLHDRRERSPTYLEKSPHDLSWQSNDQETIRTNETSNERQSRKIGQEILSEREPDRRESSASDKDSQKDKSMQNGSVDHCGTHLNEDKDTCLDLKEPPLQDNGVAEELPSMEEDMDICDTPPLVPGVADAVPDPGKWYYLDNFGLERGPSSLCDLKTLVEGGMLMSDHLVKHLESDRWLTLENAASPLLAVNYSTIVSDSITQLASPPEASGNLLVDAGDSEQPGIHIILETSDGLAKSASRQKVTSGSADIMENLHIDERVGALLEGVTVVPGKEMETVGEILQMSFEHPRWENWSNSEGAAWQQPLIGKASEQNKYNGDVSCYLDKDVECTSSTCFDKDCDPGEFTGWFSGCWSCKGGDWRRSDEAIQDRSLKKKFVLNEGYPLCRVLKSGYEDPRCHRKDEMYCPSQGRRLDLPPWAVSWPEEKNDGSVICRTGQSKLVSARGVKGITLPVVRINACVVKDNGSFDSDLRMGSRGKDRCSMKSARPCHSSIDVKSLPEGDVFHSRSGSEHSLEGSWKSSSISTPRDCLYTADELQLHLGGWYYLDGAGHEHGPLSYSELQVFVGQGLIQNETSVFRKIDHVWVPVKSSAEVSQGGLKLPVEHDAPTADSSRSSLSPAEQGSKLLGTSDICSLFHSLYPQFIGYTRGKLHELVMKAYRRREFAAAINEVLDSWIIAKQPKKEMEKQSYAPASQNKYYLSKLDNEGSLLHEDHPYARKRAKLMVDGGEKHYEIIDGFSYSPIDEPSFDNLCGDATFHGEEVDYSEVKVSNWGVLNGHILARIFHFLRANLKSLLFAGATCKHWRAAAGFYKGISRQVELSSIGSRCSDATVRSIMSGYDKERIRSMVLVGCSNISCSVLEEILHSFSLVSAIDIRGCSQFEYLSSKFPHVNWIRSQRTQSMDSYEKLKGLNEITEKASLFSMSGLGSFVDDSSGLKDYFDMVDKRGASSQSFRQSLYKRNKINGIRNSASILSKNPRIRRWAMKKPGYWYKRMEQFLLSTLKDIMKGNNFDFFAPKVAEIEDRIRSGYYAGRGLSSVKDDINKMCRDAIKTKNRCDAGEMNRMITQFIRLAARLEDNPKTADDKSEDLTCTRKKKKLSKMEKERKNASRSNGGPYVNGVFDYADAFDRRVSRLDRKSLESGSESYDESEFSDDSRSPSKGFDSSTESDLDFHSERSAADSKDSYCIAEEGFDLMSDDREWGARMTKDSLVPPVTRRYEVIDAYHIVADEDQVHRKMQASLPDDYDEKVKAQKIGTEEMDIPEVKEFKPRKQLGDEVIEQEVYGIDPYTHNLLLDSMPEDEDWSLPEKHLFIEDVLLRTLNRQVRHFTGSGNTPMMHPLKNVIRDILETSMDDCNTRNMKMCEALLKAIDGRTEDNYVAYRKGLGVVCNREGGFGEEDFVVEFLGEVYPAWKWFEKQDGIRSLQKNTEDPAPEFYNIYLERPKGDAKGYDLVVVDAMHKANYASRICHSCRPNCEAKVTAVDGQYQIGIYSVRPIGFGEEITFDYNSVTESKEEYEASVCLCGSQICRGSYLNLTGEGAFLKVLKQCHGLLDRHSLLLEACELNWVSEDDYIVLSKAGLGSCLLGGLPDWLIAYSARLVRFISFERTKLPEVILRHNLEEKRKYFAHICMEDEQSDAEIQAEGVCNQRLQNLALTLDKVRYVMRCVFGDPKKAPPPLQRLSPDEMVSFLWKGESSVVEELLECIAPHMDNSMLSDLRSNIMAHDPSGSDDIAKELKKSLLWLRDEVRSLPCTYKCRHDAAADMIHIYAHTKHFFKIREYKSVTSPPVYISSLDLGPKYADKLPGLTEYCKTYGENYCLGQLIYWFNQTSADPDRTLARSSRGCLSLPEIGSFYEKLQKSLRQRVYGPITVKFLLSRMEKHSQRPWPTDKIWAFESSFKVFGSPMLDAVLGKSKSLERDMVVWLRNRPAIFQATWDR